MRQLDLPVRTAKNMNIQKLKLESIDIQVAQNARAAVNKEVVSDYAERKKAGDKFPPVIVFDDGKVKRLSDGLHRYLADKQNKSEEIEADVREGGELDAVKHALHANVEHGLRRTNADKRRIVEVAFKNLVGEEWSDNRIAEMCGVSQPFVSQMKKELKIVIKSETRTGRDNKRYPAKRKSAAVKSAKHGDARVQVRQVKGLINKTKPDQRGEIITSILELKRPVIVASKSKLQRVFQSWFKNQVKEETNGGKQK
jgi:hypothetical protein